MTSFKNTCATFLFILTAAAQAHAASPSQGFNSTTTTNEFGANGKNFLTMTDTGTSLTSEFMGPVLFNGPISEGPLTDANGNVTGYATTINTDGSAVIGSNTTASPAPAALTVNGDLAVLKQETLSSSCATLHLGTIAHDSAGKLLSCQTSGATQVWQPAQPSNSSYAAALATLPSLSTGYSAPLMTLQMSGANGTTFGVHFSSTLGASSSVSPRETPIPFSVGLVLDNNSPIYNFAKCGSYISGVNIGGASSIYAPIAVSCDGVITIPNDGASHSVAAYLLRDDGINANGGSFIIINGNSATALTATPLTQ